MREDSQEVPPGFPSSKVKLKAEEAAIATIMPVWNKIVISGQDIN